MKIDKKIGNKKNRLSVQTEGRSDMRNRYSQVRQSTKAQQTEGRRNKEATGKTDIVS